MLPTVSALQRGGKSERVQYRTLPTVSAWWKERACAVQDATDGVGVVERVSVCSTGRYRRCRRGGKRERMQYRTLPTVSALQHGGKSERVQYRTLPTVSVWWKESVCSTGRY